ncbi:GNAT family N-acetyltransferase [Moellerella wisconsensis]|uniref:GNAT family N-acetyltransferase n=1 Tax=Moellerella wisconsensis TaxID=158849 RepID=UPI0030763DEB
MKIRRFMYGDELPLLAVFISSVRGLAIQDYTPEQIDAWAPQQSARSKWDNDDWQQKMRTLRPFVVEIKQQIVGYADLQSTGYIDHFFVAQHAARQGVGSLLMQHIEAQAKILNLSELTADVSLTAEPFFARHGFQIIKRNRAICQGVTLLNASMKKSI